MPVFECGHHSDTGDRFCRECGSRLVAADDDLLLLDADPTRTTESVIRHRSITRKWQPFAAIAVAIIVGWSAWAVLGTPVLETSKTQDPANTEPDEEEGSAPERDSQPDFGKDDDPPPTSIVEQEVRATTPAIATTNDVPLLGAEVDYRLLISTNGRPAVLDLNNGVVQYTEGSRISPVAVSGGWLVLQRADTSRLTRIPLDDLGAGPTELLAGQDIIFTNVLPTVGPARPGQLWVITYLQNTIEDGDNIQQALQLVDLQSGTVVDHPIAETLITGFLGGRFSDETGGLITSPAGGVYATTPDGFQQVAEGRLITADQSKALVEQCDPTYSCEQLWLDRNTWQPLNLAVPNESRPIIVALPGTDWVLSSALSNTGPASLVNVETNQTVDVKLSESTNSLVLPAVSPDGEWLAELGEDPHTVDLRNLSTNETISVILEVPIKSPLFFIQP